MMATTSPVPEGGHAHRQKGEVKLLAERDDWLGVSVKPNDTPLTLTLQKH